jgi:hypothetical protein
LSNLSLCLPTPVVQREIHHRATQWKPISTVIERFQSYFSSLISPS